MAKSSTLSTNPVAAAIGQALASGTIARSTCDSLIRSYSDTYPDERDGLLEAIRKNKITVLERR
jgi:hypothetical protein